MNINDVRKNEILPSNVIVPSKKCHPATIKIINEIKGTLTNETSLLTEDFRIKRIIHIPTEIDNNEKIINNFKSEFYSDSANEEYPFDSLVRPMLAGIKNASNTFRTGLKEGEARIVSARNQIKDAKIFSNNSKLSANINWLVNEIETVIPLKMHFLPSLRSLPYVNYYCSRMSLMSAFMSPSPASISLAIFFRYLPGITNTASNIFSTVKGYLETCKEIEFLKDRVNLLKKNRENSTQPEPCKTEFAIEIEPRSMPSDIDKRVLVSKYTWALTLITFQGLCGNHAQLIIEGINDGFYDSKLARGAKFTHLIDIDHYDIRSRLIKKPEFERRSEIWMRPCHLVKKMILDIQDQEPKAINLLGRRTIVPKIVDYIGGDNDNCLTYLQENLKTTEVFLKEKPLDSLVALATFYTEKPEYYNDLTPTIEI